MDHAFWRERWQKGEIGFHSDKVQPALAAHWPKLAMTTGARVLVPLCGKNVDMIWLAAQGCEVIGAELSELAVDAFFAEQGLTPDVSRRGGFTLKRAGTISILVGDFFALTPADVGPLDAVYDRAALVAMPPEMQPQYAAKLAELTSAGAPILLIGLDYNPAEMSGPPFNIAQPRVRTLFEPAFAIDVLDARDGLAKSDHLAKRGITRLEEATYFMRRTA